jgi:hypothetical protein
MQTQVHPLEPFFRQAVRTSYEDKLGINDPEMTGYVAHMLCEFTEVGNIHKLCDELGRPIEDLEEMIHASDPVHGLASSFDAERSMRRSIGDYALFVAGIYPETTLTGSRLRPSLGELIRVGKESYHIVSQFNLFEYEEEAPLFARLSDSFERCILGLALVREELGTTNMLPKPSDLQ